MDIFIKFSVNGFGWTLVSSLDHDPMIPIGRFSDGKPDDIGVSEIVDLVERS